MYDKSGDCRYDTTTTTTIVDLKLCWSTTSYAIFTRGIIQSVSDVLEKLECSFTCVFVYFTEDFVPQNVYFETRKGDGPLNLS